MALIFSDGACRGNPGPGGWGTIVADHEGLVRELGGHAAHTTNNRMEIEGALRGLAILAAGTNVRLYTDSKYLIQSAQEWLRGWQKNGWKTASGGDVLHQDLWQEYLRQRERLGKLEFHHVAGHSGIPGNERCDEIATAFADGVTPDLYTGPAAGYTIDLNSITAAPGLAPAKKAAPRKKGSFYYVSWVGGVWARDQTWSECEARVKGRAGARFQKCASAEEEQEIRQRWGVPAGVNPVGTRSK